eukprot:TRINITY_DN18312_c0_g1_i1.p1 TRINITY_DN18312_c0_g1~~TRINITY_DN18312_c0_g1_i1.p1  ORF type:complete len:314 (-),score=47.53 TRINITY_DN18312_c0_g1_i1:169-1110(-)
MRTGFSLGIYVRLLILVASHSEEARGGKAKDADSPALLQANASSVVDDRLVQLLKDISSSLLKEEEETPRRSGRNSMSRIDELSKASKKDLQSIVIEQERRLSHLESLIKEKCDDKYSEKNYRALEARLQNLEFLLLEEEASATNTNKRNGRNFIGDYSNRVLSEDRNSYYTVAFNAFRNEPFYRPQSYVNYDGTNVNVGRGLNPKTGLFVAPLPGIYLFSFHALTKDGQPAYVKLNHNGRNVAGSYRRHEVEIPTGMPDNTDRLASSKAEGMLSQTVLLNLSKGDEVGVFAYHGNIRDGGWHYTQFVGFRIN